MKLIPVVASAWRRIHGLPEEVKHLTTYSAGALREARKISRRSAQEGFEHLEKNLIRDENGDGDNLPDVLLDVPILKVDEIKLKVDNMEARVALNAQLANLVSINVGADVVIGEVDLDIKGVEAQALLKVRLKQVYAILARALETLDNNPDLIRNLSSLVGEVAGTIGRETGRTVGAIGETVKGPLLTGNTVKEVARGVTAREGPVEEAVEGASQGAAQAIQGERVVKEKKRRHFRKKEMDKETPTAGKRRPARVRLKS